LRPNPNYYPHTITIVAEEVQVPIELWVFLGQALLLGVGALATIILVPHFTNKYQKKQKDLDLAREAREKKSDIEREKRQIDIDRKREDRRQQLEIQKELIEQVTSALSKGGFINMLESGRILSKKIDLPRVQIREYAIESFIVEPLLNLYYGNESEICKEWDKLIGVIDWGIDHITSVIEDPTYDEAEMKIRLQSILKKIHSEIKLEEALKKLQKEGGFYDVYDEIEAVGFFGFLKMIEKTPPKIN